GASVITCRASAEKRFAVDGNAVRRALEEYRPRLAFLCNPNNPTVAKIVPADIAAWVEQEPQTLFIVDEAYLPFPDGRDSAGNLHASNVLVLRSMTKDFGLAGLRLGYALGTEEMIACPGRVRPPWGAN